MLKDILTKITGGGIVKKFIILTVIIIILLDVLMAIVMEIDLNKTLSDDFNERGQFLSRHLAIESGGGELLSKQDTVNLQEIIENMKNTEKNDVKYVYITDPAGNVVVHTFEGPFPGELLNASTDNSDTSRLLDVEWGHITEFKAPIPGERAGYVHIGLDRTSIDEKLNRTTHIIIFNILIEGGLGIMVAFIAGNYLARPIRSLVKGAEEIGRGNLGYQIEAGPNDDEIHTLSNAFNRMSYNLNKSISELRTSEERYRNLVDGISDAVFLIDSQKRIISWNIAAQGIFGWTSEEVVGKKIDMLFCSPITTEDQLDGEIFFIKKDGSLFPGVVRTKPLQEGGYVMVIRDITDQKEMEKLEKQLLQSDKLATVGQLAAGIAHEINNPLGNISLYTQMMLKKAADENIKDKLVVINDEANRAAKIVKGLLDFARQSEPELSPLDMNKEIGKVIGMLNLQLKDFSIQNPRLKDIRVTTDLGPLPLILADSGQIRQVIMNLLTNSVQSISKDGEIIVKTVAKEGFVEMSISDNGYGIPKENLTKIFDPFFTTKEHGKGTGLGLSVSYGIIKRHNGSIEVESEVGKGTTVTIKLPA